MRAIFIYCNKIKIAFWFLNSYGLGCFFFFFNPEGGKTLINMYCEYGSFSTRRTWIQVLVLLTTYYKTLGKK